MRVLGLDPGTIKMGWAVVDSTATGLMLVASGVIAPRPLSLKIPQRLAFIWKATDKIIEHYGPDAMAIEAGFIGRNAQTGMAIGKARGLCETLAGLSDTPIKEYAPTQVKRAVVSSGRASKEEVMGIVNAMFGLTDQAKRIVSDDQSDAVAVAVCHLNVIEEEGMLERMEVTA